MGPNFSPLAPPGSTHTIPAFTLHLRIVQREGFPPPNSPLAILAGGIILPLLLWYKLIRKQEMVDKSSDENAVPVLRRIHVQVQGRDGRAHEFVILPEGRPPATLAGGTLRLTAPPTAIMAKAPVAAQKEAKKSTGPAESFFSRHRDPSNLVLTWLEPDSWLELEKVGTSTKAAVVDSGCWLSRNMMAGHSRRFQPEERKAAYVRHRKSVWRVAKGFQDLRRFARSPDSVFNPGASLGKIYRAERSTGVIFPDEARASFSLFDGQARSAWLRSEGVIGGFALLSLEQSVELMLEEGCFRGGADEIEFVPLADRRNSNAWLVAAVDDGRICLVKPLSRPKLPFGADCYTRVAKLVAGTHLLRVCRFSRSSYFGLPQHQRDAEGLGRWLRLKNPPPCVLMRAAH